MMKKTPKLITPFFPTVTPANWAEVDSNNKPSKTRRLSSRVLRKIRKDGL